jgi:ribosomal protein L44E
MSTKSRTAIWGPQIKGAEIHARHAREEAKKAARAADREEARAWSLRMEGYGGPAQPSPTIGQCISGGLGWLEVECNRCNTNGPKL